MKIKVSCMARAIINGRALWVKIDCARDLSDGDAMLVRVVQNCAYIILFLFFGTVMVQ